MSSQIDALELKKKVADLCLDGYYSHGDEQYPIWNHWGLYLDRSATGLVIDKLAQSLDELAGQYDIVCPLPTSGFPIAGMLFARCEAQVLASFHWKDARMHAEDELLKICSGMSRPVRVCAIDSVVHTGTSLFLANAMIERRLNGTIVSLLAIADNDLVSSDLVDPIKKQFAKDDKLRTLFSVSDLERVWRGRREDIVQRRTSTPVVATR
jgi:orotate phosphoribosyltransferase